MFCGIFMARHHSIDHKKSVLMARVFWIQVQPVNHALKWRVLIANKVSASNDRVIGAELRKRTKFSIKNNFNTIFFGIQVCIQIHLKMNMVLAIFDEANNNTLNVGTRN